MRECVQRWLVCPSCLPREVELEVRVRRREDDDIVSGSLLCSRCGGEYPIREGIAFLHPDPQWQPIPSNKYEMAPVVSSYLWSHYGDLLGDEEHLDAYRVWASLADARGGRALDIGCAVGRFALDLSAQSELVIGVDLSLSFVRAARRMAREGKVVVDLIEEGNILRNVTIPASPLWRPERVEFLVADALSLPFRSSTFTTVASLNVVDKVPVPLEHLREMDRVASADDAQVILSDPFSWSREVAEEEHWLGGRKEGRFSGYGIDNIEHLLGGKGDVFSSPWEIERKGACWWKIRTHRNHFELIRSLYLTARRGRGLEGISTLVTIDERGEDDAREHCL